MVTGVGLSSTVGSKERGTIKSSGEPSTLGEGEKN